MVRAAGSTVPVEKGQQVVAVPHASFPRVKGLPAHGMRAEPMQENCGHCQIHSEPNWGLCCLSAAMVLVPSLGPLQSPPALPEKTMPAVPGEFI